MCWYCLSDCKQRYTNNYLTDLNETWWNDAFWSEEEPTQYGADSVEGGGGMQEFVFTFFIIASLGIF